MRQAGDTFVLSPTDISSFLACRHRTGLDMAVALGRMARPERVDPFAAALQRLGDAHERRYVEWLRASGLSIAEVGGVPDALAQTVHAMRSGVDVIVQARLEAADGTDSRAGGLAGYADVLRRVPRPSALGAWSYEVQDTKLARETKGGTILQLSAYSAMLTEMQGRRPDAFHVVVPAPHGDAAPVSVHGYRVGDYAAYFRMVLAALRASVERSFEALVAAHYPEPVEACGVCRWERRCEGRRRADDHLSYVAGARRVHRIELVQQGYATLAAAAAMPVPLPFVPARGSSDTYERLADQARLQCQQRDTQRPVFERLPVTPGEGLSRLPAPSPDDMFVDLEGARLARDGGRDYLFGIWHRGTYTAFWATTDAEERLAFERVMDLVSEAWSRDAAMHVYHFNHYEPTAFKRLMGRYATRAELLDQLLRSRRFVDLYPVLRQAVRAGVESYSIKRLEPFTGYTRTVALADANERLVGLELALESQAPETITAEMRAVVQGYNEDDCRSTEVLRNWLEGLRAEAIADGAVIERPAEEAGDPTPAISELDADVEALRARLLADLPAAIPKGHHETDVSDPVASASSVARASVSSALSAAPPSGASAARLRRDGGLRPMAAFGGRQPAAIPKGHGETDVSDPVSSTPSAAPSSVSSALSAAPLSVTSASSAAPASSASSVALAYLIDFHRREEKAEWWEHYRLQEMPADALVNEPHAIGGLSFVERLELVVDKRRGRPTGSVIDGYTYPLQEIEIGPGNTLRLQEGGTFGTVVAHDRERRRISVKKGRAVADTHPAAVFQSDVVSTRVLQQAVMRLAREALDGSGPDGDGCGMSLLRRDRPRLSGTGFEAIDGETAQARAVRLATALDGTALAIQGPPGAGKTFVGAQMIRALVKAGKRVGVTAVSHKVIRNLLDEVMAQAAEAGERVAAGVKVKDARDGGNGTVDEASAGTVREIGGNDEALEALATRDVLLLGGTPWLWAREEARRTVDVLFIDEAGQMSLANALAVSHAAGSLVLLGDPQQLQQPGKGTHPDGIAVSALDHVLGGHETMPGDRGIFLPVTYRMSPAVCRFTSELFYAGALESEPSLGAQVLTGTDGLDGSALWLLPVEHDGNQAYSDEEVDAVAALVARLTRDGAQWVDKSGTRCPLTAADIRVVAPFNAQVNRLAERLAPLGVPVGTVDRFQGQTAAVVIYSMATSRAEDAPHGMDFLYSRHRLNVATSRARCAAFIVLSPHLLEPACHTPEQMHLANALCRYREMARVMGTEGQDE